VKRRERGKGKVTAEPKKIIERERSRCFLWEWYRVRKNVERRVGRKGEVGGDEGEIENKKKGGVLKCGS